MTVEEEIRHWMHGREDELVEALAPLIAAESTRSEAKPGMPFGEGPAKALDRALELARRRLGFEELFLLSCGLQMLRSRRRDVAGPACRASDSPARRCAPGTPSCT